jgi:hypothetical protein
VRGGEWQLAGRAVGRLVGGGGAGVPDRRGMAARTTSACRRVGVGGGDVRGCGAAQDEGEPRSGNRAFPVGAAAVSLVITPRSEASCVAHRRSVRACRER